ncbi:MAG: glycosyltransferase, partial [Acidimicrobiales bacterium]
LGLGPAAAAAVAARRGIARRFFVYPAITYPHKNHAVLLDALARLEGGEGRGVDLGFTGRADRAEAALAARAAELGLAGRVHRLGRIPRPELDALISGAVALLFPSTYEGFGAPALEAMALGCPVVASAGGALAEVVGDAGLLVDPHDPGAWAEAMGGLLASPERRRTLAAAGARRAGEFSAEASARALAAAYRRALMEPTPP